MENPEFVDPEYQRLAQHLISGAAGLTLFDDLSAKFPAISRHDCFLGIALAWSIREAELLIAEGELKLLKKP